jgi:hypothetical protein
VFEYLSSSTKKFRASQSNEQFKIERFASCGISQAGWTASRTYRRKFAQNDEGFDTCKKFFLMGWVAMPLPTFLRQKLSQQGTRSAVRIDGTLVAIRAA